MSGKSYGSSISWSCKHNKHTTCFKLKCTCDCHKQWNPATSKSVKKTDDRLSPSPRFYCSVAATTLLTNGDFPAGNRLILKVIGWRQKDASGEGFADCWLQITRLVGAWPNCFRYGHT